MKKYVYVYASSYVTRKYIVNEVATRYGYYITNDIKQADMVVYTLSEHSSLPPHATIMGIPCVSIEELRK